MRKEIIVCDRCKAEMYRQGATFGGITFGGMSFSQFNHYKNGAWTYDLCQECADKIVEFIDNPGGDNGKES